MYYVGILEGAKNNWGVRIPDLVGCHGAGSTADAALADATSAAREWAEHQTGRGVSLPKPRAMTDIIADKAAEFDTAAGESLVMIPVVVERGRSVKANISLDAGTLAAIDEAAKRRGLTRSAFFTSAALEKIEAGG